MILPEDYIDNLVHVNPVEPVHVISPAPAPHPVVPPSRTDTVELTFSGHVYLYDKVPAVGTLVVLKDQSRNQTLATDHVDNSGGYSITIKRVSSLIPHFLTIQIVPKTVQNKYFKGVKLSKEVSVSPVRSNVVDFVGVKPMTSGEAHTEITHIIHTLFSASYNAHAKFNYQTRHGWFGSWAPCNVDYEFVMTQAVPETVSDFNPNPKYNPDYPIIIHTKTPVLINNGVNRIELKKVGDKGSETLSLPLCGVGISQFDKAITFTFTLVKKDSTGAEVDIAYKINNTSDFENAVHNISGSVAQKMVLSAGSELHEFEISKIQIFHQQIHYTVKGHVLGYTGYPIENTKVELQYNGQTKATAQTFADGSYQLDVDFIDTLNHLPVVVKVTGNNAIMGELQKYHVPTSTKITLDQSKKEYNIDFVGSQPLPDKLDTNVFVVYADSLIPVKQAKITYNGNEATTDEQGKAKIWGKPGEIITAHITLDGVEFSHNKTTYSPDLEFNVRIPNRPGEITKVTLFARKTEVVVSPVEKPHPIPIPKTEPELQPKPMPVIAPSPEQPTETVPTGEYGMDITGAESSPTSGLDTKTLLMLGAVAVVAFFVFKAK